MKLIAYKPASYNCDNDYEALTKYNTKYKYNYVPSNEFVRKKKEK